MEPFLILGFAEPYLGLAEPYLGLAEPHLGLAEPYPGAAEPYPNRDPLEKSNKKNKVKKRPFYVYFYVKKLIFSSPAPRSRSTFAGFSDVKGSAHFLRVRPYFFERSQKI